MSQNNRFSIGWLWTVCSVTFFSSSNHRVKSFSLFHIGNIETVKILAGYADVNQKGRFLDGKRLTAMDTAANNGKLSMTQKRTIDQSEQTIFTYILS